MNIKNSADYIPRLNNDSTNYASIYDCSRSPSPEPKHGLCFYFKKKESKKPRTPVLIPKQRTVFEKVPNFKVPEYKKINQGNFAAIPPASPGQIRLESRLSFPSNNSNHGDSKSRSTTVALPNVLANIGRKEKSIKEATVKTIDREHLLKLHELETENERLKTLAEVSKSKDGSHSKIIADKKKSSHEIGMFQQCEKNEEKSNCSGMVTFNDRPYGRVKKTNRSEQILEGKEIKRKRKYEQGKKGKDEFIANTKQHLAQRKNEIIKSSLTPASQSKYNVNNTNTSAVNSDDHVFVGSRRQLLAQGKKESKNMKVRNVRFCECEDSDDC